MLKQTIHAALMIIFAAAIVQAQSPDLPLSAAGVAQLDSDVTIEVQPSVSEPMHADAMHADAVVTQEMMMGDCGCQNAAACTACGSHQSYRTFKEKCAYYRSVRQAFDRGPCCDASFGGFGPLWDTYCADKQRCGAAKCAPAASCQSRAAYPQLFKRHRPFASRCNACGVAQSTCDCVSPMSEMHSDVPVDIGQPPQPTEADAPAAAPPQVETPAEPAEKETSARRGWPNRSLSWNTNR